MRFLATAFAAFAAGVAALPAPAPNCNADNCLRAVRASAFPTRLVRPDCSSYFQATVTPALSTLTITNTAYATATVVEDAVETDTVLQTLTQTIDNTATQTISYTTTVSITQYSAGLVKRQQTEIPTAIPLYASACSGSVRYESACSCIGITRTTTTVPAETTTVFTDITITDSTTTLTTTISTQYVTVVDATNTLQTTVATVTTSTAVATATDITYIRLQDRFALQVEGAGLTGQWVYRSSYNLLGITDTLTTIFHIEEDGFVYHNGEKVSTLGGWLPTYQSSPVVFPSSDVAANYDPSGGSIDGAQFLFHEGNVSTPVAKTWVCKNDRQWYYINGLALTTQSQTFLKFDAVCEVITLKAVPVPF